MNKRVKHVLQLLTLLCLCLVLTACGFGSSSKDTGKDSNTLIYASQDFTTINPLLNTHEEIPSVIFSGLMKYNQGGKPVPDLAEKYTYDPATYTYTFNLRKDVKWHDGKPFNAEDVKFTYDTLTKDKNLEADIKDNYDDVDEVKVIDPYTVSIKLKGPNAGMLDYFTVGLLPKHLLEGKNIMTDPFNQHPIGTGKYKFVSWETGQNVIVEKNTDYYGKVPSIDKVVFKIVTDENARALQIKSGDVDLALLNAQNADALRNNDKLQIFDFKTADYRAIAPNFVVPFWQQNKDIIGILGDALDKEAIVKSTLQGHGTVAYSPIQLNKEYNDPNINQHKYNPEKFKQEIEARGWKLGKDGIYEKNGQKLAFSIDARENEEERIAMAQVASQQFKAVGVQMDVHIVQKLNWKKLESFLIGEAAPFDPDDGTFMYFVTDASANYTHYSNPQVDKLLREARATMDTTKRKALYSEFQKVWSDNPAYIMLAYLDGSYVATPRLHGLDTKRVLGHHAVGVMWNIEDWTLDPK